MKVGIGADHAGYGLKEQLQREVAWVEWVDFGTHSSDSCDYPDIAKAVCEAVLAGEVDTAILVCGTGVGMSITANKVPGIRAAACSETYTARLTRDHNDANVLCLGSRVVGAGTAGEIVQVWLATDYSHDQRHQRRLEKIRELEAQAAG